MRFLFFLFKPANTKIHTPPADYISLDSGMEEALNVYLFLKAWHFIEYYDIIMSVALQYILKTGNDLSFAINKRLWNLLKRLKDRAHKIHIHNNLFCPSLELQ